MELTRKVYDKFCKKYFEINEIEADIIFTLDNHIYHQDYIIAKEERISTHFVTGAASPLADKKKTSH